MAQLEDDEPYLDGKISPGECCGELSFFFAMRHIYTAKVSVPEVQTFFIERAGFQQLLKMYHNEGEVISHNALTAYKTAWNRAGSAKSGASGKSAKSVQETMDELVGGNLKHMISMLRRRQELEAIEKAMKYASRGSVSELKKQLDNGVGVNATNHDKRTCLHIASCQGHTEMVTFLLDVMGADFSIVDLHGNVPMNDAGAARAVSPLTVPGSP